MKRRIVIFLAVALAAVSGRAESKWRDPSTGYTWTYYTTDDTAVIGNSYSTAAISPKPTGSIRIPATLGGKPVTSIHYAFYGCDGLCI